MKKKFVILLLLTVFLASFAPEARAFDGDRKGFVLNLGAGAGQGKLKVSGDGGSLSEDGTGFSTVFKIGGGVSEQVVLYYTNRVIWWSSEGVSVNTGMSAAGVSYFFQPQAPAFFLTGALGLGVAKVEDFDAESGIGFGIGAGFEFSRNWTVEIQYLSAKVDEAAGLDLTASNLAVTLSWFAY